MDSDCLLVCICKLAVGVTCTRVAGTTLPVEKHFSFVVANGNVVALRGDIEGGDVAERSALRWPVGEDRQ